MGLLGDLFASGVFCFSLKLFLFSILVILIVKQEGGDRTSHDTE